MSINRISVVMDNVTDVWIVEELAENEFDVTVINPSANHLSELERGVETILNKKKEKWLITDSEKRVVLSRIHYETNIVIVKEADIVIESLNQNVEDKKSIVNKIDRLTAPDVIIVTNAISYKVSDLQRDLINPERLIGVHFIRNIYEVIRGEQTGEKIFNNTCSLIHKTGNSYIEVKENHGYVFTRLTLNLLKESVSILDEKLTTEEELEKLMKRAFHLKMGPLEYADRIGLDEILKQMERLYSKTGDEKFIPLSRIKSLVEAGYTGMKAGRGFFRYDARGNRMNQNKKVYSI
ncbi:MAG TPA: 3-hydroxyacyl-CoA dehydrogenase NAD-binding domain-containing protein [Pseudogracilibacillus sp.]|nr:3-hydroxyacyl-CoA dehydrogenase NAD-binding domain-containing protein [Pseudogracilibacillus sp.]